MTDAGFTGSLSRRARRVLDAVNGMDTVDLVTRLTLVLLLVDDVVVSPELRFRMPLWLLAVAGLAFSPLHRSRRLWCLVAALMIWKSWALWWVQDNYAFLLTYWSLALALSLGLPHARHAIAVNGRLLVGLAMGLAVLWKGVLSPDYTDGSFFEYALATDPRFHDARAIAAGVTGWSARGIAVALTWWTLCIEAAIAVSFLWAAVRGGRAAPWRNALLLLFASTTYLIATVDGFGWTMLILGLAQCERDRRVTRLLYLLLPLVLLLYQHVPILTAVRKVLVG